MRCSGKRTAGESPALVVDELEGILNRYNPDMLWIADDVFTIHHGWLTEFAAEMSRRAVPDSLRMHIPRGPLNARVADFSPELHCFRIWIGSESGSQRVLDAMERGVTVEEVRTAVEACKARGIQTGMFLMWGYEGEELADIEATVSHVRRTQPDIFLTTVAYPIGGTPYFAEVADALVSPAPWAEGSDRKFEFARTTLPTVLRKRGSTSEGGGRIREALARRQCGYARSGWPELNRRIEDGP